MERQNREPSKRSQHSQSSGRQLPDTLRQILHQFLQALKNVALFIRQCAQQIWGSLKHLRQNFLKSFARWVDPKLEPYRNEKRCKNYNNSEDTPPKETVIVEEAIYHETAPSTREDIFAIIREAPMSILSSQERKAMAAVLSLPDVKVSEIMTPSPKIVFVDKDEVLGPLVLDRLYRSGFTHFPVINGKQNIIGTLQTARLNSLDEKSTHQAREVMDPRTYYIRYDYSLEQALKAFLRTDSQLMLVVDHYEKLTGMLTFSQLMDYLFSEKYQDEFDRDDDRLAVAKRKLPNMDQHHG